MPSTNSRSGVRVGPGAVPGLAGADDVVAEHALHVGAGRRHLRGHVGRAVQPLLFPGDGGEHQGAGELAGGEQPGELEHDRDAGAVVIGAGGVAGEVQHVGHPGVQVPGHDVVPRRGRGALQGRDDVGDRGRHRDPAARPAARTSAAARSCCRDEVAAMACICPNTQAVAAPMPRTGSVWLDAVCRVPNWISRSTVAWMRPGSTSPAGPAGRRRAGRWVRAEPGRAVAAPAGTPRVTMGAVTAVTAVADRNERRLGPLAPGTKLLSMPRTNDRSGQKSSHYPDGHRPAVPGPR